MSTETFEEKFCHAWTPARPGTMEELQTRQRMAALVGVDTKIQEKMGFQGGSLIVWRMKPSVQKPGHYYIILRREPYLRNLTETRLDGTPCINIREDGKQVETVSSYDETTGEMTTIQKVIGHDYPEFIIKRKRDGDKLVISNFCKDEVVGEDLIMTPAIQSEEDEAL